MKKSVNKFALILWIFAVIFLIADVPMALGLKEALLHVRYPDGTAEGMVLTWMNIWTETRSALLGALQLAALGTLIEIADQIRWNGLHRRDVGNSN